MLGERFDHALMAAADLHRLQVRKATTIPYLSHLLAVCSLVLTSGGGEDEAIAALLHDAVEDQGGQATLEMIRARFGDRVAGIVEACSDTDEVPKPPAMERKRHYVEHLDRDTTDRSVLLVSAADKVHNLTSILADHRQIGDELWGRFNLKPTEHLWYYRALAGIYRRRLGGSLADSLDGLVTQLAAIVGPGTETAEVTGLRWARLGFIVDCAFAGLGDPGALASPANREPSRAGWLQQQGSGGSGMLLGFAETDGLPVEIGLSGSNVVAARMEFVDDLSAVECSGPPFCSVTTSEATDRTVDRDVEQK